MSRVALNANRNPTSALTAENSALDWLLALRALANRVASWSIGSMFARSAASAVSSARTRARAPGAASTRMRLTRPSRPAISWA